jgi:hypothetical protein
MGSDSGASLDRVNAVLSQQQRFVRASRSTWALRAWNIPEYVGIARAIGQRIDASAREVSVNDVVADLLVTFQDITGSSIRTYMSTLEFVVRDGMVRRRTKADGWPPVAPLNTVRGAFRNGDNEIRVAHAVTSEMLRGSGQYVHPAVATAAGVHPGERRTFISPHGQITMSWKLSSTTGASLGSLRALAVATGASDGDTLVLAFRLADASLGVTRLGPDVVGVPRLQMLLGHQVRSPVAALAAGLNCRRGDAAAVLRARGDRELASLLDSS